MEEIESKEKALSALTVPRPRADIPECRVDELVEETCDSESAWESRSVICSGRSRSRRSSGQVLFFIPDDCLSSTSDSDALSETSIRDLEMTVEGEGEGDELLCAFDYLKKASDDELGIPPPSPSLCVQKDSSSSESSAQRPFDIDFSFTDEAETRQKQEQSLFWLRFLTSQ